MPPRHSLEEQPTHVQNGKEQEKKNYYKTIKQKPWCFLHDKVCFKEEEEEEKKKETPQTVIHKFMTSVSCTWNKHYLLAEFNGTGQRHAPGGWAALAAGLPGRPLFLGGAQRPLSRPHGDGGGVRRGWGTRPSSSPPSTPQRSMPTNKRPLPSPPRAPFFEPDANLTLTSIIRSALCKLVVFPPTHPQLQPRPPRPLPHHPLPFLTGGEHLLGSTLQHSPCHRWIRPGPRPHARTHTALPCTPRTRPRRLPYTPDPPRAGRPT